MDAVKFIEEHKKLCERYVTCSGCPANDNNDRCRFSVTLGDEAAKQIELLEEWAAARHRKTRQDVFLEQWTNVALDRHGISVLCPKQLNCEFSCIDENDTATPKRCKDCTACRREFWMQEVE